METGNQHFDPNHIPEISISYHPDIKAADRPLVSVHEDAHHIFRLVWDTGRIELQEEFKLILLNAANRLLGVYHCSTGGTTSTIVDNRLILAAAIKCNATKIILGHNHPSGNLFPSERDRMLTAGLKTAAKYMNIGLVDHLILTSSSYFSFAKEGLL